MILVDSREKMGRKTDPQQLCALIRRFGVPAEPHYLEFGDFTFSGFDDQGIISIGVERKRLKDLSMSIDDGRLEGHQRVGMMETGLYHESWLIVEGVWRPHDPKGLIMEGDDKGGWWFFKPHRGYPVLYSKLSRFIMSLQRTGMMYLPTRDMVHTAWAVVDLYHYYQKRKHRSPRELAKPNIASLNGEPPLVRKWAEAIDGVGQVKGQAAAELFETPIALATSEEIQWLCIDGIGPKTARSIMEQIEGKR